MSTSQQAAASDSVDRLEEAKIRARAAEAARLQAAADKLEAERLAKEQAILAKQAELAAIREQEVAVPKTGTIQQGTKQEKGIYAGFVRDHKPVYVMNNVPNMVPAYTEQEKAQLNALFGQEVQKQAELDKLLGTDTASTLKAPAFPVEDTKYSGGNVTVDYAATIKLAQDTGVHLPVSSGLAPTFQKDLEKQFEKLDTRKHYFLELNEGAPATPAEKITQAEVVQKPVTPQNPRLHILTGQPESKYANPDYSKTKQKVEQGSLESLPGTQYTLSLTEGGKGPTDYFIGLTEGGQAQRITKYSDLTQPQIDQIKKINAYNKSQTAELKASLKKIKDSGVKFITIKTDTGVKTVPIENAYYEIKKAKGVQGIGAVQNIPEGSSVFFSGGEVYTIPEQPVFVGPVKPAEQDYIKNLGSVLGLPDLAQAEPLQKYYNEPGRVTSNKTPLPSRELRNGPITTAQQGAMSPIQKASDFVEGLGTGLTRTSLIITNAMPEAFIEIAKTGNPLAGEAVLQKHEKELKDIGLGSSVVPSIESGRPTGRSPFYNVGEAIGEIGPVLYGLKGAFKNPFYKAPVKPKIPQTEAPEIAAPKSATPVSIKAYPVAKLRNLGFEDRPTLGKNFIPPEEKVLAKIRAIPAPPTEIGGGKGAKDFGNLREQIANVKQKTAQIKVEPVKEDVFYNPAQNIEKVRAKEIGTYRVESERMLGSDTTNPLKDVLPKAEPLVKDVGTAKPSIKETLIRMELEKSHPQIFEKKAFERSAIDAEIRRQANKPKIIKTEVKLGVGGTKVFRGIIRGGNLVPLGTGRGFYVSRSTGESGGRRFSSPPAPPKEGEGGKGKQVLLLEKPTETKEFTSTKVELGKGDVVLITGAGAGAAAPLPFVLATEQDQSAIGLNGTGTNGTATQTESPVIAQQAPEKPTLSTSAKAAAVTLPKVIITSPRKTITSLKQKQEITQRPKQKTVPAEITKPAQKTVQREKLFSVLNLGQPESFAQRQRQGKPFPFPQTQKLKTPTPFPQPQKLKQPEPLRTKEPPQANFGFARGKEFRARKEKKSKPSAFVGNVSDVDIALGFNRTEITPGVKRSAKRYRKDIQFAYKREGFTKLITQKNRSILSKKERSILEREKPKEVKRKKRKTGGFF